MKVEIKKQYWVHNNCTAKSESITFDLANEEEVIALLQTINQEEDNISWEIKPGKVFL